MHLLLMMFSYMFFVVFKKVIVSVAHYVARHDLVDGVRLRLVEFSDEIALHLLWSHELARPRDGERGLQLVPPPLRVRMQRRVMKSGSIVQSSVFLHCYVLNCSSIN